MSPFDELRLCREVLKAIGFINRIDAPWCEASGGSADSWREKQIREKQNAYNKAFSAVRFCKEFSVLPDSELIEVVSALQSSYSQWFRSLPATEQQKARAV